MEIQIVKEPIKKSVLEEIAKDQFVDLVKVVVDIEQEIMAIGGEMHADEEVELISKYGSLRENTWGINLWIKRDNMIEYDSMINLKANKNRTRNIESPEVREKIVQTVSKLIK